MTHCNPDTLFLWYTNLNCILICNLNIIITSIVIKKKLKYFEKSLSVIKLNNQNSYDCIIILCTL